jgi:hypothetical protein
VTPFEYDIKNCPGLELVCIWEEIKWKWTVKTKLILWTHAIHFVAFIISFIYHKNAL